MLNNNKVGTGGLSSWAPKPSQAADKMKQVPEAYLQSAKSLSEEVVSLAYNGYAQAQDVVYSSVAYAKQSAAYYVPNFVDESSILDHPAHSLLNPQEQQQLHRLPVKYKSKIIQGVDKNTTPLAMRMQLNQNLKSVMQEMVGGNIDFKENGNSTWELESLLDLSNAINNLPLAHKKQLDGVTFLRQEKADIDFSGPKQDGMLEDMAVQMIAGHYDIQAKTVTLYDRGLKDQLPKLGEHLKHNLRQIQTAQSGKYSASLESLQAMLNPYLTAANQPTLEPDGKWGENTEHAIRTVQGKLLAEHMRKSYDLSPIQEQELKSLEEMSSSPQFEMLSRFVNLKDKLEGVNLLPDTHMKQLLNELSQGQFGEASLKFLLNDVSNAFRTSPHVSRTEELMTHEMGHHFQLGLKNESHYISEFAKLSGWVENSNNQLADGFKASSYSPEQAMDVYNQLASDGKTDDGFYRHTENNFVTEYASTDPMEDFAESYKTFVLNPTALLKAAPSKFLFMNSMPTIQSRKMGAGAKEKAHYSADQIKQMATGVMKEKYGRNYTPHHLKSFLQDNFNNILGQGPKPPPFHLSPDTLLAIVDTHRPLMKSIDMAYISKSDIQKHSNDQDLEVLRLMYEHGTNLMDTANKSNQHLSKEISSDFFSTYLAPENIDNNFPHLSDKMKKNIKDPAFSSMIKAMAQIGGHAILINQVKRDDIKDQKSFSQAKDYFSMAMKQPSALLSRQVLTQSYQYLTGLGESIYNPEDYKVKASLAFFDKLKSDPAQTFSDWDKYPKQFQEMLQNERFVSGVSGDQGRFLPSAEVIKGSLEKVMSVIEFQRGIDKFRNRGTGRQN